MVLMVAVLLAVLLSAVLDVTLAVLAATSPLALTEMMTLAVAPEAKMPKLQVTVVVPVQAPWLELEETKSRGSVSVTTTFAADCGPWFTTSKT